MILEVPYYSQFKNTQKEEWKNKACGIAALKMVLDFYKPTGLSIDDLYQKGLDIDGYLENVGWYHHGLANIAKSLGFIGITRLWSIPEEYIPRLTGRGFTQEDLEIMSKELLEEGIFTLKNELNQNHPVIVSIPRDFKQDGSGHLAVLIGYDEEGFFVNDPDDEKQDGQKVKLSFEEFKKVWTKRAIIIYPK